MTEQQPDPQQPNQPQQYQPQQPPPQQQPVMPVADNDTRAANLAQAVARNVASGWRVESQSPYQAILVKGGITNHTLHLILTIVTCGAWGLVWLIMVLVNQRQTQVLTVDNYGNVLTQ